MTKPQWSVRAPRTAGDHVVWALYAFALFGWELLVVLVADPLLVTWTQSAAAVTHWLLTIAGWSIGSVLIMRVLRSGGDREILAPSQHGYVAPRAAGVVAAAVTAVLVRALLTGEWKPLAEYERLTAEHGGAAGLMAVVLLAYYLSEVVVVVLLMALGQRAGELATGHRLVPWGGLMLAVTWGATHVLLQGPSAGLYAMGASVLYGLIYVLGPRAPLPTVALIAITFVL